MEHWVIHGACQVSMPSFVIKGNVRQQIISLYVLASMIFKNSNEILCIYSQVSVYRSVYTLIDSFIWFR